MLYFYKKNVKFPSAGGSIA